jgi:hypothetical protein
MTELCIAARGPSRDFRAPAKEPRRCRAVRREATSRPTRRPGACATCYGSASRCCGIVASSTGRPTAMQAPNASDAVRFFRADALIRKPVRNSISIVMQLWFAVDASK